MCLSFSVIAIISVGICVILGMQVVVSVSECLCVEVIVSVSVSYLVSGRFGVPLSVSSCLVLLVTVSVRLLVIVFKSVLMLVLDLVCVCYVSLHHQCKC